MSPQNCPAHDEHAATLYTFLLRFTGQEADAHDLLQEVFVKLAGRHGASIQARNERAFLWQTYYHLGIDWTRRHEVRHHYEAACAARVFLAMREINPANPAHRMVVIPDQSKPVTFKVRMIRGSEAKGVPYG